MPHRRQLLAASSTDAVAKLRDTQHRKRPIQMYLHTPSMTSPSCRRSCGGCILHLLFSQQAMQLLPMPTPNHCGIDNKVPVHSVWPPVLWSEAFRRPLRDFAAAAADRRAKWVQRFGFSPRAIFLFAGRWSAEKRIHLLIDAMPQDCGLIIVGDSDADYADEIEASGSFCSMGFLSSTHDRKGSNYIQPTAGNPMN